MIEDAKQHKQEDKVQREKVELSNQTEQLIYKVEKDIEEKKDEFSDEDKATMDEKISKLKSVQGGSKEDIETAMTELSLTLQTITDKMYEKSKQQESVQQEAPIDKNKVEDAEFEVVE
jgi:molecular chaperone DnaK